MYVLHTSYYLLYYACLSYHIVVCVYAYICICIHVYYFVFNFISLRSIPCHSSLNNDWIVRVESGATSKRMMILFRVVGVGGHLIGVAAWATPDGAKISDATIATATAFLLDVDFFGMLNRRAVVTQHEKSPWRNAHRCPATSPLSQKVANDGSSAYQHANEPEYPSKWEDQISASCWGFHRH